MFELPEAKRYAQPILWKPILMKVIDRVRRDEIASPSSSTRSSPEVIPADNEEAHARLAQLLSFDISTSPAQNGQPIEPLTQEKDKNDDEEEEFEFRLFSAPKPTPSTTTKQDTSKGSEGEEIKTQKLKIRLRSPTPVDAQPGDGRFIVPFRGWRYYFTKPELMHISPGDAIEEAQIAAEELNRRKEYEDIAVTGSEVLNWAKNTSTPGCHLPWRVFRLDWKFHRVPKSLLRETENISTNAAAVAEAEKKKSKPGKKRRIILRTRAAAKAAEKAKAEATSNMTEAEKRNRKNRERKIKRRQKEREKKAAMAATAGTATTTGGAGPTSVDGDTSD